jgi:ubiquinone biosynthesis protein
MQVQPQLVLLQKTLLNIEGLGRQLYPELDLWTTAKPFMERWMKDQIGPRAFLSRLKRNLGPYSEELPELPLLAYRVLHGVDQQTIPIHKRNGELNQVRVDVLLHYSRIRSLIFGATIAISGFLILLSSSSPLMASSFIPFMSVIVIVLGIGLMIVRG